MRATVVGITQSDFQEPHVVVRWDGDEELQYIHPQSPHFAGVEVGSEVDIPDEVYEGLVNPEAESE